MGEEEGKVLVEIIFTECPKTRQDWCKMAQSR